MPHASRSTSAPAPASAEHPTPAAQTELTADLAAVARFLRELAERVEHDPAFGHQIATLLAEAGPLPSIPATAAPARRPTRATAASRRAATGTEPATSSLDPYALLREEGEDALRARLDTLTAPELHAVIRAHRLDPARISARWASQSRLRDLIVEQVRARADHGKAFSRV